MSDVKYPEIIVELSNNDGNAFSILGTVTKEMKKEKIPKEEIDNFLKEAKSGDYDNLLSTCMKWVKVY